MIQGVQLDMLSADRLSKMTSYEKIRLILDDVHQGCVVVLERGLTPEEQGKLLEATMMEIAQEDSQVSRLRLIRLLAVTRVSSVSSSRRVTIPV